MRLRRGSLVGGGGEAGDDKLQITRNLFLHSVLARRWAGVCVYVCDAYIPMTLPSSLPPSLPPSLSLTFSRQCHPSCIVHCVQCLHFVYIVHGIKYFVLIIKAYMGHRLIHAHIIALYHRIISHISHYIVIALYMHTYTPTHTALPGAFFSLPNHLQGVLHCPAIIHAHIHASNCPPPPLPLHL